MLAEHLSPPPTLTRRNPLYGKLFAAAPYACVLVCVCVCVCACVRACVRACVCVGGSVLL